MEMIGEIKLFAGNFAPRDWAFCNGDVLSINENAALFSILGTTYGGDGRTNFHLPKLAPLDEVASGKEHDSVAAGDHSTYVHGLNYIICLQGIYPSRP